MRIPLPIAVIWAREHNRMAILVGSCGWSARRLEYPFGDCVWCGFGGCFRSLAWVWCVDSASVSASDLGFGGEDKVGCE